MSLQNISLHTMLAVSDDQMRALSIALAGLIIVFVALILISAFIASLPHLLRWLDHFWPETEEVHVSTSHPQTDVAHEDALLAAIGFVLHTELQRQLAAESATGRDAQ